MANESTAGSPASRRTGSEESLERQAETLKAELAQVSTKLSELVKSGVRQGRARAERAAEGYVRQGQEQADAALDTARAYGEALEGQITRNPFTAVLVALGLGYLVGLMGRR